MMIIRLYNIYETAMAVERKYMTLQKTITALMISASLAASIAPAMPAYAATSTSTSTEAKIEHKDYLQELVNAGTISQSTYDKIKAYMTEHAPEKTDKLDKTKLTDEQLSELKAKRSNTDGTRPERPEKTEDGTKPERPAKTEKDTATGEGMNRGGHLQMFDEMLKDNVISQSEYDSIKSSIPERTEKGNRTKGKSVTTTETALPS